VVKVESKQSKPVSEIRESAQSKEAEDVEPKSTAFQTYSKGVSTAKSNRSSCNSISEAYFGYNNRAPSARKRLNTNRNGSPELIDHSRSITSSPERGQGKRSSHIPIAARETTNQFLHGPWVPPIPNAPILAPPAPPHTADKWQFSSLVPPAPHLHIPKTEPSINIKRLSIPPSTILRPLLAHGRLAVSPNKAEFNDMDGPPVPPKSTPPRTRAGTGNMLKNVMANAVERRMTDPKNRTCC